MKDNKVQTYIMVGNDESGYVELDLVAFREKGEESRYLVTKLTSVAAMEHDEPKKSEFYISIDSEEEFNKLKSFFSQLEWGA